MVGYYGARWELSVCVYIGSLWLYEDTDGTNRLLVQSCRYQFNTRTAEPILVTRTAKWGLLGAPLPAMIFDIFQVLLDKFIRFSSFDRGMMAAPQDIKSLRGCHVLWSKWRHKLENWKNTTKIGHFRIIEHNYVSGHDISEIPTATPHIFDHAQFDCTIIDIDRHPPTARKQNGLV